MRAFSCGVWSEKIKSCLRCREFFVTGLGSGHCIKHNKDTCQTESCKYYKREYEIFYADGRIKDKDLYNETFLI